MMEILTGERLVDRVSQRVLVGTSDSFADLSIVSVGSGDSSRLWLFSQREQQGYFTTEDILLKHH